MKIIALVSFLCCSTLLTLANPYYPLDMRIEKSSFIVEGRLVKITDGYKLLSDDGKQETETIYTSYIVEVLKIFKGEISTKYVEVTSYGGVYENISSFPSCTVYLIEEGNIGMFFLNATKRPLTRFNSSLFQEKDKTILYPISHAIDYGGYTMKDEDYTPVPDYPWEQEDMPDYYRNVEKHLYKRIERITKQKRRIIRAASVVHPKVQAYLQTNHQSLRQKGIHLTTDFGPYIEEENPNLYNFYINVNSMNQQFIDVHEIRFTIQYDTTAFGSYIVDNQNVRNSLISPDTWEITYPISLKKVLKKAYDFTLCDLEEDKFVVAITAVDTSQGILQISRNILAHLQMKIKDIDSSPNLIFLNEETDYYDYESNAIESLLTYATDTLWRPLNHHLKPIITSFFPDTLHYGVDTLLTISGKHLMSTQPLVVVKIGNGKWKKQSVQLATDTLLKVKLNLPAKAIEKFDNEPITISFGVKKHGVVPIGNGAYEKIMLIRHK